MASWTVDAAGYPSYIATVDGKLAYKHERQGDVWWSVKDETADGGYRRVLTIKIGETLPPEACWKPPTSPKEAETQGLPGSETPKESLRTAPVRSNSADPKQKETAPDLGQNGVQASRAATRRAQHSEPKASPPDPDNPFTEIGPELQKSIHAAGPRQRPKSQLRPHHPDTVGAGPGRPSQVSHCRQGRLLLLRRSWPPAITMTGEAGRVHLYKPCGIRARQRRRPCSPSHERSARSWGS